MSMTELPLADQWHRDRRPAGRRARRRARFGRPDLDPDLLAARLPDRLRSAAARARACRRSASSAPRCGSTPTRSGRSTDAWPTPATSRAATAPARTSPTGRRSAAARRRWPASWPRCSGARRTPASPPTRWPRRRSPRPPSASGPGPLVRVLFAECTNADAGYDAERLVDAFPGMIEAEGALLDDLPERLDRFHYDLVATTTFHADEAQALRRRPRAGRGDARRPGLRRARPRDRRPAARLAGRARLRVGARRGQHRARRSPCPGPSGVEIVSALIGGDDDLELRRPDRRPHPDVARGAGGRPRAERFSRPERIRPWTYDFDPSGLELLRRAIEHVAATRPPRRRRPTRPSRPG